MSESPKYPKLWAIGVLIASVLVMSACGGAESDVEHIYVDGDIGHESDQPDANQPDANQPDASQPDASQPDASQPDADPSVPASYTSLYSDPDAQRLFVTRRDQAGVRLFELTGDGADESAWSEVRLPESLREEPQVQISSVVSTEFDVLMSTHAHGAWRLEQDATDWAAFSPDWFEGTGRITHLRKMRDQVYAFHEAVPGSSDDIELWERDQLDWSFVRNDMFMIIDYMPREDMLLRATRYGTVEISHDEGQSWEVVPGIVSQMPPRIFEWGEDVAVATTFGVWITRDGGHGWDQLSTRGGRAAAMMGDELVVVDASGRVLAVGRADGTSRELPALPGESFGELQVAVAGDGLFVTTGGSDILKLPASSQQWQPFDPAR